jgi:hypothetical protein
MKTKINQWIFNPFIYVAGWSSLGIGLIIIFLTAMISYFSGTHIEVISIGFGDKAPLWFFIFETLFAWIVLCITLYIAGRIVSKTSFRIIDLIGTQALARLPLLAGSLLGFPELSQSVTKYLLWKTVRIGEENIASHLEIVLYVFILIVLIMVIIWTITLMYNAYKVCCNLKGPSAGISFALGLISAQIIVAEVIKFVFRDL